MHQSDQLTIKIKEVPDIQRYMWLNPNSIEAGLVWNRREYPLDMRVDFIGRDEGGKVVLVEAKNQAKKRKRKRKNPRPKHYDPSKKGKNKYYNRLKRIAYYDKTGK